MKENQKKFLKIVFFILVGGILIFLIVKYWLPVSRLLGTEEGRKLLAEWLEKAGIFAPLVFVLLMALQIVIAFIPGGPLEIVAGVMFGGFWGTVLTVTGAFLGTLLVYFMVKKFGTSLVQKFVTEEKLKKFSVLEDEEKLEFWVFILFLIPGIPKDLLTYIVPLTKINGKIFLILSTLARFPALLSSVMVGDSLSAGRYWLVVVIACLSVVAVFAGAELRKHILKENSVK